MPADLWSKFSLVGRVNDGVGDEVIKELDMNRPSKADPIRTRLTGLFRFFSTKNQPLQTTVSDSLPLAIWYCFASSITYFKCVNLLKSKEMVLDFGIMY